MTIPVPTGEYAVGTFTYTVKNDREEVLNPSGMRSVASRVYYPVPKDRTKDCTKARCMSRNMAEGIRKLFRLRLNYDRMEAAGENVSACYEDAPKPEGTRFPLIMFSHGLGSYREGNSFLCIDLASHGYVVISVAHSLDGICTEFDDGSFVPFDRSIMKKLYQPYIRGVIAALKMMKAKGTVEELSEKFDRFQDRYCGFQKARLEEWVRDTQASLNYAKENRFSNPVFYIDDGYTGTNFDRPGFQKMLSDAQTGKVGTIVTKDLSRLGRDSTMVGYYQKYVFPQLEIRYIAVNDHYDSANPNSVDNDMALFKNLFNEFYPLDTSRKIRAVKRMRGESGKTLTYIVPYGYVKDPDNSNHWIVDEDAAKVVKYIFALCIEGRGPSQIAKQLESENILTPTAYKIEKGLSIAGTLKSSPCHWDDSSVVRILEHREYTGCTVAFKTYTNSMWDKKMRFNPVENQVITPNTHEAIIDEETFNKVQKIRESRHRLTKTGKSHIFSGLVHCYDCGSLMYYCTTKYFKSNYLRKTLMQY